MRHDEVVHLVPTRKQMAFISGSEDQGLHALNTALARGLDLREAPDPGWRRLSLC